MTWADGEPDGRTARQPYQGSYPTSPFEAAQRVPGQAGSYPQFDPQFGQYPPYTQRPSPDWGPQGRRTGQLIVAGVVTAVLALGVVAGLALRRDEPQPVASPVPTSSRPSLSSSTTVPRPAPTVPGWQVATSSKRNLAYEVPPEWKVKDEDAIIGFEDASGPKVGMSGVSTYKEGYCAESNGWRAGAGFTGYQDSDLSIVATDAAGKWGRFGYLGDGGAQPRVDVAAPDAITVNGINGVYATATIQVTAPTACSPPTARVHAVALPATEGGSYAFVLFADQDVPDAISDELARKIINTIRAY